MVAPAPAPNACDPAAKPVSVTVRSVLGSLADDDASPDADALRLSVYPARSLLEAVYASARVAVAVVPGLADGNVTVPDSPDSDTISLTLPLAVTVPLAEGLLGDGLGEGPGPELTVPITDTVPSA